MSKAVGDHLLTILEGLFDAISSESVLSRIFHHSWLISKNPIPPKYSTDSVTKALSYLSNSFNSPKNLSVSEMLVFVSHHDFFFFLSSLPPLHSQRYFCDRSLFRFAFLLFPYFSIFHHQLPREVFTSSSKSAYWNGPNKQREKWVRRSFFD